MYMHFKIQSVVQPFLRVLEIAWSGQGCRPAVVDLEPFDLPVSVSPTRGGGREGGRVRERDRQRGEIKRRFVWKKLKASKVTPDAER